jgi:2-C-methyl-D-erythritol 2,4-cyclodiphosphate synthase
VFRVGFGYDVHQLTKRRALIIGGCHIPHPLGLQGHSDADVLTHAIIDAILGALAKGDIGKHFPDTDPAYEGADSLLLLERVMESVREDGYRVNNVDSTVVAQEPQLAPHIREMKKNIAGVLDLQREQVNIKASTTEGLGPAGRREGIEAYAVVSLIAIQQ